MEFAEMFDLTRPLSSISFSEIEAMRMKREAELRMLCEEKHADVRELPSTSLPNSPKSWYLMFGSMEYEIGNNIQEAIEYIRGL